MILEKFAWNHRVTGICWDSLGVAVAEVENPSSDPVVTKWAWAPWDSETPEERANTIRRLFMEYDFTRKTVVSCLTQKAVLIKKVQLPAASLSETKAMALLQAQKSLPLLTEELEVESEVLERGEKKERPVALVIAKRREAEAVYSTLSSAGIRPEKIIPESHALLASFRYRGPLKGLSAVIHVDGDLAILIFSQRGIVVFVRDVDLIGPDPDARFEDNRVLSEWGKCSEVLEDTGWPVENILLTGDAALSPSLKERLHKEAGCPVATSDPFSIAARLGGAPENIEGQSCALMALGAALSADSAQINFLPRGEKIRRSKIRRHRELAGSIAACFFICLSVGAMIFQKTNEMKRRLSLIDTRLAELGPKPREAEKMFEQINQARRRRDPRGSVLSVAGTLIKTMAVDISLRSLDYKKGNLILIQGTARSLALAASWVQRLAQSGVFKGVELRSSSAHTISGENLVDFQVEADLSADQKKKYPRD